MIISDRPYRFSLIYSPLFLPGKCGSRKISAANASQMAYAIMGVPDACSAISDRIRSEIFEFNDAFREFGVRPYAICSKHWKFIGHKILDFLPNWPFPFIFSPIFHKMQTMNLKFCLAILCCLLVGLEGMKRHGNQRDEERRKLESLRKGIKNLDGNISVIKPWLIMLGNDNARGRVSFQKMCIEAIQKGDIESLKKWADKIKNGKKQPKKVEQTGMNDKAKGRKQKQKKDEIGNVAQNEDRVQNVEEKMEKVEEEEDAESEHEEFEVVEGFDEIVNDLHTADKRNILLLREILLINHNCAKNVVDACSGAVKKIEEFLKNVEEIQEQALAAQQSAKNGANSIWLSNSDEVNVDIL